MTTSQQQKDSSVCLRLKSEREAAKLTQQEVASALEVSIKTVTRWEKATPIPSDKLGALARLELDVLYILTGEKRRAEGVKEEGVYAKTQSAAESGLLNTRESTVLDCLRQLKPEYQYMLEGIAKSMLETQKAQQVMDDFMGGNKNKDQNDDWWPEGPED